MSSDIVERLRAWVYTDSLYATAREAADEIERLRLSSGGDCPTPDNAAKRDTLTAEEREVLGSVADDARYRAMGWTEQVIRGLLERLGGEQ